MNLLDLFPSTGCPFPCLSVPSSLAHDSVRALKRANEGFTYIIAYLSFN
jgi:hypothetical protein